jgi:type VI secretion system FHA domain protein
MEPWAAPKDAPSGWAPQPAGRWGEEPVADEWSQPAAAITGRGPMAQRFAPPPVETEPVHDPVDVWSRVAATHDVDWARGGFGAGGWADPAPAQAPAAAVSTAPITAQAGAGAWQALLEGAGLSAAQIKGDPAEASRAAGVLLKQLISGLVVLLEARARAKAQLGAQGTLYQREGSNNPLKWARSPSDALVQLLSAPERGSMPADQAVQDSFKDLQAHQMATLVAMQGALRDTLDRFSPASIRQRAETRGVLAKIIPSAREAELWRAYEREFQGVVEGSDEAFMDVFAKAFREAYDKASGGGG